MEEYELVPTTPIRRLERRIEEIEKALEKERGATFVKDIVDIIKTNQLIIDELVRSNEALKMEISKLYPKLDALVSQMSELLNFIRASIAEELIGPEIFKPVAKRLDEMNKKLSEEVEALKALIEELRKERRKEEKVEAPEKRKIIIAVPKKA